MRKKKHFILFFIVLSCFLLVLALGMILSNQRVESTMVYGYYAGRYLFPWWTKAQREGIYEGNRLNLELHSDGTYSYTRTQTDGREFTKSGTWELAGAYIYLYGFDFDFLPSTRSSMDLKPDAEARPSVCSLPIKKTFTGRVKISVDTDNGYYLVKER